MSARTFAQAAETILARFDRAAARLRGELSKPFTVAGGGSDAACEKEADALFKTVTDMVALRRVELADANTTRPTIPPPPPYVPPNAADLGLVPTGDR